MLSELLGPNGTLPFRGRGKQGSQSAGFFQAHAEHADAVLRGGVYYAHTAATGVAPGTAIGTTAPFALYNPSGSGVNAVILLGAMGYVSGTLGAGFISWCVNTDKMAALPTGTAIVEVGALVGLANNQCAALTTATIAAPSPARVFGNLDAALASSVVGPWALQDYVNGALVLTPGTTLSLQATAAAGTSPVVVYSVAWEEIPV